MVKWCLHLTNFVGLSTVLMMKLGPFVADYKYVDSETFGIYG